MKKWSQMAKSHHSLGVLDLCQPPWPGEVGYIGNLRDGEEGERWKECQVLKRVNNLRPIPQGRTNSSIPSVIHHSD